MSIENVTSAKAKIMSTEAYKTLTAFFDPDTFVSVDTLAKSKDTYAEVVAGFGMVEGLPVYAFAQNSDFCGGAMSKAQATKIPLKETEREARRCKAAIRDILYMTCDDLGNKVTVKKEKKR